jgi:uncharacterized protein (DUF2344 family)
VVAIAKDPKTGTGKKPKGSGRRLYTDENPKDTVSIKFATVADAQATARKVKRINKPFARKIQILTVLEQSNIIHQSQTQNQNEEDLKKMPLKKSQKSLKNWSKQKWRTKSGKPSSKTGERYLPEKAIKALSPQEYAATTRAKRKGTKAGKQFVKQPKKIAKKTRKYR